MQRYLKVLLPAAFVVCLGLLVANHSQSQTTQTAEEEHVARVVEDGYKKTVDELNVKLATAETEQARLLVECQKGVVAYDELTEFQKTEIPAPVCEEQTEEPAEQAEAGGISATVE